MRRDFRRIVYHFTPKPEAGEMEHGAASLAAGTRLGCAKNCKSLKAKEIRTG
jgi:hypothetical protein